MTQPVHRAVVKLHGTGIYLPSLAVQESAHEPQFWEMPLKQRQIPSRPGLQNEWFDMKLSESWLFSYNHVGLFELKAPALHSTRQGIKSVFTTKTEGNVQNLTNQPMPTCPSFTSFNMWNCCRCRRQGQWELIVYYLPLSREICWGCIIQVILCSREDALKDFSSNTVAQIVVALSHSYSPCIWHHPPLLLSSGLAFSYLKLDSSCLFL